MHSSRMRTGRSLTVCCRLLPGVGRGFSLPGGCLPGPGGGFSLPGGGASAWRGVPGPGGFLVQGGSPCRGEGVGVCLVPRGGGLPGPGGGGVLPARGVCLAGGAWSRGVPGSGGFSLPGGGGGGLPGPEGWGSAWSRGGASPETPPVNRITNTCKNITLATTSLRPVIRQI